jgi:hypothetical protein
MAPGARRSALGAPHRGAAEDGLHSNLVQRLRRNTLLATGADSGDVKTREHGRRLCTQTWGVSGLHAASPRGDLDDQTWQRLVSSGQRPQLARGQQHEHHAKKARSPD